MPGRGAKTLIAPLSGPGSRNGVSLRAKRHRLDEYSLDGLGASAALRGAADGRVDLTHAPGGTCHGSLDVNLAECVAGTDDHGLLLVAGHRQTAPEDRDNAGALFGQEEQRRSG